MGNPTNVIEKPKRKVISSIKLKKQIREWRQKHDVSYQRKISSTALSFDEKSSPRYRSSTGPKIVTLQKRKKLSKEELDKFWEIEEPRLPREVLLKDDAIIPQVKELIRRSSFIPQRTPEWFKMRRGRVTGSAVASVLGHNKYQSRNKLMRQKLGLDPPFQGNKYTQYGNRMEPHAAFAYQKKSGLRLIECDLGLMSHPDEEYECIAASCDGVTTCGVLIEIKCPYTRKIVPGLIPAHYLDQIMMNLFVHGLKKAHFIDYRPAGNGMPEICEITEVKYDPAWIKMFFPMIKKFSEELRQGLAEQDKLKRKIITVDPEEKTNDEGIPKGFLFF